MSEAIDAASIVAAVQNELTKYSQQVSAEVQRLRDDIVAEQANRVRLDEQLRALASALEQSHQSNSAFQGELQRALEERLTEFGTQTKRRHDEMNERIGKMVDEANKAVTASVESVARPVLKAVEHRQDKVETDVASLEKTLSKFDDQAGRMVNHVNELTRATEQRLDSIQQKVATEVDERLSAQALRIDEVSAQAARHQSEVSNIVGTRVDEAEERLVDKINTTEARITEEVGSRVADIDAYVGRVSAGLDESVSLLSDRIAAVDSKFAEVNEVLAAMEQSIKSVDSEAIEELKEKVSGAAGEAMLVRIEMERLQKTTTEEMDKAALRLTELETQLQEQSLDVETAVQLERLEEVERAVIALDPAQFVKRSEIGGLSANGNGNGNGAAAPTAPSTPTAPTAPPDGPSFTMTPPTTPAQTDLSSEPVGSLDPPVSAQQ